MTVENHQYKLSERTVSPTDRLIGSAKTLLVSQPLVAGIGAGFLFGGISNSGIVFFLSILICFLLSMHIKSQVDA